MRHNRLTTNSASKVRRNDPCIESSGAKRMSRYPARIETIVVVRIATTAPPSGIIDAIHEASTTGGTSLSDGLMHTLGDHQTSANSEPRIPEFASSASPGSEARSLLIPDTPMTICLDAADEQFDTLYEASKESSLPVKSTAELTTTTLFHQKLDLSREATFKQSYLRAKALNEHWSRIFS